LTAFFSVGLPCHHVLEAGRFILSMSPASTAKMLFEVQGSSHNVANSPKNHGNVIGAYGLSWMKTHLEGDTRYKKFLLRPFPSINTSRSKHNLTP
jgi:hypothetical protein